MSADLKPRWLVISDSERLGQLSVLRRFCARTTQAVDGQVEALAPDVTAAILDGRQPRGLSANLMLKDVPVGWDRQREMWDFAKGRS